MKTRWTQLWKRITLNFHPFKKNFLLIWGSSTTLISLFLSFFSWENLKIGSPLHRLSILVLLFLVVALISLVLACLQKSRHVFGNETRGVTVEYGDMIKLGFPEQASGRRIVVIPVNRCFDLTSAQNLVDPSSIHGQWLSRYISDTQAEATVQEQIFSALESRNEPFSLLTHQQKTHGNLKRYRPGTVVELPGDNQVTFYLLALAEYNHDLEVNCCERDFYQVIQGLIDYYAAHGQSAELYCSLMGDHVVEPAKESQDTLDLMLSMLRFNRQKIHGQIHLVVHDKRRSDIGIA